MAIMKTKKRVVNKKLTTEHPAVREARRILRLARKAIKANQQICYMHHLEKYLQIIIRAK